LCRRQNVLSLLIKPHGVPKLICVAYVAPPTCSGASRCFRVPAGGGTPLKPPHKPILGQRRPVQRVPGAACLSQGHHPPLREPYRWHNQGNQAIQGTDMTRVGLIPASQLRRRLHSDTPVLRDFTQACLRHSPLPAQHPENQQSAPQHGAADACNRHRGLCSPPATPKISLVPYGLWRHDEVPLLESSGDSSLFSERAIDVQRKRGLPSGPAVQLRWCLASTALIEGASGASPPLGCLGVGTHGGWTPKREEGAAGVSVELC
jgi:hypothetical protein